MATCLPQTRFLFSAITFNSHLSYVLIQFRIQCKLHLRSVSDFDRHISEDKASFIQWFPSQRLHRSRLPHSIVVLLRHSCNPKRHCQIVSLIVPVVSTTRPVVPLPVQPCSGAPSRNIKINLAYQPASPLACFLHQQIELLKGYSVVQDVFTSIHHNQRYQISNSRSSDSNRTSLLPEHVTALLFSLQPVHTGYLRLCS